MYDSHSKDRYVSSIIWLGLLWLYAEQLQRWTAQKLADAQRREVGRLTGQLERLDQAITDILALADELKGGTIEKMLAKSDEQLGLEFLLRRSPEQDR